MTTGVADTFQQYRNGVKNGEPHDTAVETVCRQIRHLILCKEFRAGQKLSEIGLSQRLEVSRTPVREALKVLAGDGLLTLVPKSGVWVANPSKREVEDAYALR
ncbi:GntR family transcriptional regulator, partial [Synergistaceae bacterium OttesenSCG-928-I11]|nr:GntR family transcriptional regulator [Synergistaceae bacterium OttesenSCG-928-I11]